MTVESTFLTGWLVAVDSDALPSVCALADGVLTIGRAPGCTVIVPVSTVSRQHARISRYGMRLVIDDVKSANGTFVNGCQIDAPHMLSDEDFISLGKHGPLFQFLIRPHALAISPESNL